MLYKLIAAALLLFALHGCKKTEEVICPACATDSLCSPEYRYYSVSVMDGDGRPVRLDRFETVNLSNGKALSRNVTAEEIDLGHRTGFYPLADDNQRAELNTCEKEYEFRGYAGNEVLVSRKFTLRDDCCHVDLVRGDPYITYP
jgi:hypothetical protein